MSWFTVSSLPKVMLFYRALAISLLLIYDVTYKYLDAVRISNCLIYSVTRACIHRPVLIIHDYIYIYE